MTFKEKLQMEHPEYVNERFTGGVKACPYHYGYEKNLNCMVWESNAECEECWNREMPNTETKSYNQNLRERIIEEIYHAIDSDRQMCIGADIQNYLLKVLEDNMDYNKGLNDAWKLAKKITNLPQRMIYEIFKIEDAYLLDVFEDNTYKEAIEKMKAYEEAQTFRHGEIVIVNSSDEKGIVIVECQDGEYKVLMEDFDIVKLPASKLAKTGRCVVLENILG